MAQYAASSGSIIGTSPTSATAPQQPPQHKRVYQACIPCRRRKVRCDLGSVDNPHDPPCVRCRRESKECYFSATRRKRRTEDGLDGIDGIDGGEDEIDEYIIRNGRKRLRADGTPPRLDHRQFSSVPLTPGGSQGRREPLRRPDGSRSVDSVGHVSSRRSDFSGGGQDDSNAQLENFEAQSVMRKGVFNPHDALDLLYKAATDRLVEHHSNEDHDGNVAANILRSPVANHKRDDLPHSSTSATLPSQPAHDSLSASEVPRRHVRHQRSLESGVKVEPLIDPQLMKRDLPSEPGYAEALKAWSRFRFVRAGWFTPQEAIEYID